MSARFSFAEDLSSTLLAAGAAVLALAAILLFVELRARGRGARLVALSGLFAFVLLALALARPARVKAEANLQLRCPIEPATRPGSSASGWARSGRAGRPFRPSSLG